jgi:hypothetical protein
MPQGQSALTFVDNGGRHPTVPHSPSTRLLSFPFQAPIKSRATRCAEITHLRYKLRPSGYYNEFIVEPGAPHPPPRNSARLSYTHRPVPCRRAFLMYDTTTSLPAVYIRNIIPTGDFAPLLEHLALSGRSDAGFHAGANFALTGF